jgi:hypothetical protein
MRKIAVILILGLTIILAAPFLLHSHWWGATLCLIAAFLWLIPIQHFEKLRISLALAIFVFCGMVGIFLEHSSVLTLTSFVLLLITWDMDWYTRANQIYIHDPINAETAWQFFISHLNRVLIITGIGWTLGFAAMYIRVQINFGFALLLIAILILSLQQVVRLIHNSQE